MKKTIEEKVNPSHYRGKSGIQLIDLIEYFNLNFSAGNAVKYIIRVDQKDDAEVDLEKAIWYLERLDYDMYNRKYRIPSRNNTHGKAFELFYKYVEEFDLPEWKLLALDMILGFQNSRKRNDNPVQRAIDLLKEQRSEIQN